MASINDFPRRVYEEALDAVYSQLMERRRTDPTFTPDDLRGFLKDAYSRQGDDWLGRGLLENTKLAAIIAAYESVLAEWEAASDSDAETATNQ